MVARQHFVAESLGRSTTTSSTAQTKCTLTFLPDVNKGYIIFAQATVDIGAANQFCTVELHEDATGARQLGEFVLKTTGERAHFHALWAIFPSGSPTTKNLYLRFKNSNNSTTVGIQDARIVALRLETDDKIVAGSWVQNTATATWFDSSSLTFTPPTTGDYLVLAAANPNTNGGPGYARARLLLDGSTSYGDVSSLIQTGDYIDAQWITAAKVNLSNASHTFKIQGYNADPASPYMMYVDLPLIVALRLDAFPDQTVAQDLGQATTTSTTLQTRSTVTESLSTGVDYLVIGTAALKASSASGFVEGAVADNGAGLGSNAVRQPLSSPASAQWSHLFRAAIVTPGSGDSGARTFTNQFKSNDAAVTATIEHSMVAILQLEENQPLFGTSIASTLAFGTGAVSVAAPLMGTSIPSTLAFGTGGITQQGVLVGGASISSALAFGTGSLSKEQWITGTDVGSIPAYDPSLDGSVGQGVVGSDSIASALAFGSDGAVVKVLALVGTNDGSIASTLAFGAGSAQWDNYIIGYAGIPSRLQFGANIVPPLPPSTPSERMRVLWPEPYMAKVFPRWHTWDEELVDRPRTVVLYGDDIVPNTLTGYASIPSALAFGAGRLTQGA